MRTVQFGCTRVARFGSRCCALSSRRRTALGLAVLAASLVLAWLACRWWTRWPTVAILGNTRDTWPLAFSPDGRTFATSARGRVTLWDAGSGRVRATAGVDAGRFVVSGAFSPDGRVFAAALANHPQAIEIALVDATTGRVTARVPTGHASVYDLAFTDDGRTLRGFLGDSSGLKEAMTWDVATANETSRRSLTCRTDGCDTAVSPDGHLMAVVPYIRKVKAVTVWDLDADRELALLSDPSSPGNFGRGLAFSAHNRLLAVGRDDGAIEVWDLPARRIRTTLWGHTTDYASWVIRVAPDGRTLASRGMYLGPSSIPSNLRLGIGQTFHGPRWRPAPEVVVMDIQSGQRLAQVAEAIHPFYSADGAMIATYDTDCRVRIRMAPSPVR